jgi:hypothetical protein
MSWPESLEAAHLRARVLLAVFSRQYFQKAWCMAELDSMMARQELVGFGTPANPRLLVHAIVAHDCSKGSHIPPRYHTIQRRSFKPFVYDFADTDWGFFKDFQDSIAILAERLADTVEVAPQWSNSFPTLRPNVSPPDPPTVPRF